jgi:hypothetical protein
MKNEFEETLEEMKKRFYYAQTDFDQLAEWYYLLKKENHLLKENVRKAIILLKEDL